MSEPEDKELNQAEEYEAPDPFVDKVNARFLLRAVTALTDHELVLEIQGSVASTYREANWLKSLCDRLEAANGYNDQLKGLLLSAITPGKLTEKDWVFLNELFPED